MHIDVTLADTITDLQTEVAALRAEVSGMQQRQNEAAAAINKAYSALLTGVARFEQYHTSRQPLGFLRELVVLGKALNLLEIKKEGN